MTNDPERIGDIIPRVMKGFEDLPARPGFRQWLAAANIQPTPNRPPYLRRGGLEPAQPPGPLFGPPPPSDDEAAQAVDLSTPFE